MMAALVCPAESRGEVVGSSERSSPKTRAARTAIDAFCQGLVPLTKESFGRTFGRLPGAEAVWREYKDAREPEKAFAESEILEKARSWRREDGAVAVQLVENSLSGDWSLVVEYCFRSDGSLARVQSSLVTFDTLDEIDDAVSRLRVRYFDLRAREFAHREDVRNVTSRLPAKRVFADQTETVYRAVNDLPFASLLSGKHTERGQRGGSGTEVQGELGLGMGHRRAGRHGTARGSSTRHLAGLALPRFRNLRAGA